MHTPPNVEEAEIWVAFLNDLLRLDPNFVQRLVTTRFECNQTIADHPTVQVAVKEHEPDLVPGDHPFACGFIGVLNGCLGIHEDGTGPVAFRINLEGDEMVLEFCLTKEI